MTAIELTIDQTMKITDYQPIEELHQQVKHLCGKQLQGED